MEIMASSSSSFYASTPTSPDNRLLNELLRYSDDPGTDPPTPTVNEETESNLEGFEFETSRRFCSLISDDVIGGGGAMAFADELFSGGRVLPLKPPPKMGPDSKGSGSVSARFSPRAAWRSLWSDEFDPFEKALVNVRKEGCRRRGRRMAEDDGQLSNNKRRARSMSPFRRWFLDGPSGLPGRAGKVTGPEKAVQGPKVDVARPIGVEFARRVRLVRNGESSINNNEERESSKRRQRMKKLLPNSNKGKPAIGKSESCGELETKTGNVSANNQCNINEKTRLSKMMKMAIVHYSPKFFLCLGHGIRALGKL